MKRYVTLTILGILILIVVTFGLTYAFMKPKEKNENETQISIKACAKIVFAEKENTIINLENTYPMDDEMGLETKPYEFSISSTCEEYVGFNLYLTALATSEITDDAIHFAVTSETGDVLASDVLTNTTDGSADFDEEELSQLEKGIKGEKRNIHKVFSNNIGKNVNAHYKLYLWVDKAVEASETMNKTFTVGVSVKSFKREETFAEYLIKNKDDTLIYHDGKADYSEEVNYELEAGDLSYRYTGADPNNYICFGGNCSSDPTDEKYANLYRIIGLFDDDQDGNYELKIIKADYATAEELGRKDAYRGLYSEKNDEQHTNQYYKGDKEDYYSKVAMYYYYSNNDWNQSPLNTKNLNDYYLNTYLKEKDNSKWYNMIADHTWITEGNLKANIQKKYAKETFKNEIVNPAVGTALPTAAKTVNDKVGLMYVSDYGYAASSKYWTYELGNYGTKKDYRLVINDNWLYMGLSEWTITRMADGTTNSFCPCAAGNMCDTNTSVGYLAIRPTIYLKYDVKKEVNSGNGSSENPYRIA